MQREIHSQLLSPAKELAPGEELVLDRHPLNLGAVKLLHQIPLKAIVD